MGICQHCKNEIQGRRPQSLYCGDPCRLAAQIERRRQRIKASRAPKPGKPHTGVNVCERCGRWTKPHRRGKRFCSTTCRKEFWKWAKRNGLA